MKYIILLLLLPCFVNGQKYGVVKINTSKTIWDTAHKMVEFGLPKAGEYSLIYYKNDTSSGIEIIPGKRDYDTIPNPFGIKDKYQYPDIDKHFYDSATKRTACNTDNTICLTSDDPRVTVEYVRKDNQDSLLLAIDKIIGRLMANMRFDTTHAIILSEAEGGLYGQYTHMPLPVEAPCTIQGTSTGQTTSRKTKLK